MNEKKDRKIMEKMTDKDMLKSPIEMWGEGELRIHRDTFNNAHIDEHGNKLLPTLPSSYIGEHTCGGRIRISKLSDKITVIHCDHCNYRQGFRSHFKIKTYIDLRMYFEVNGLSAPELFELHP